MTIQGSGTITLSDIQTEFGGSNPISLSEYYRNGTYVPSSATPVPTSGTISMSDFYGTSSADLTPEPNNIFGGISGTYPSNPYSGTAITTYAPIFETFDSAITCYITITNFTNDLDTGFGPSSPSGIMTLYRRANATGSYSNVGVIASVVNGNLTSGPITSITLSPNDQIYLQATVSGGGAFVAAYYGATINLLNGAMSNAEISNCGVTMVSGTNFEP